MKILLVLRNCHSYYRYVAPIISNMKETHPDVEIELIAPDARSFSYERDDLFSALYKPVTEVTWATEKFRIFRSFLAYIYWVFLGVQSDQILERLGEKFLQRPFSESTIGKIIDENTIFNAARFLHKIRLSAFFARVELAVFRILEMLKRPDRNIASQVKEIAPDLILVTPAIHPLSYDIDYMRVGLGLRIPTIGLISSWDHLTSKGLLSVVPDRIFVWNHVQEREAKKYHAVSTKRVVMTGAPVFDRMFENRFLQSKSVFCESAQLDPERPFLLWAASSHAACGDEKIIVNRFISEMRNYPQLASLQVLIRPHPNDVHIWNNWEMKDAPVWSNPGFINTEDAQVGLYNSIYYSSAVLGLSTSLFLEAAVLDRPCALLKSSVADKDASYNKLIHFNYWLDYGFPIAVEDEMDCARWLTDVLPGSDVDREIRERFVKSFLRPRGIERLASNVASEEILELVKLS